MMSSKVKQQKTKRKFSLGRGVVYFLTIGFALLCLYPFAMVIGGSFMTQQEVLDFGFRLIPENPTFESYNMLLANPQMILNGYRITITVTVLGTILSVLVNSMMGYVLSRKQLMGKKFINFYVLFTMLFGGGMVPWYIITTQVYGLTDSIWALVLPNLVGAWNIFLVRNYFNSMPNELYESARVDGAQEFTIFTRIFLPLGKPVIATISLFIALAYWNDWWLGLMLINRDELQPLQMLLRRMMANIQFLQTMPNAPLEVQRMLANVPGDGVRFAMVILTTGPIILLYPLLQKYFIKGIMVGAVKG
jgi:ABC-type sugar transport system, permease component